MAFSSKINRTLENESLDNFIDVSCAENTPKQLPINNINNLTLPDICRKCGGKTKRAGYRICKKTGKNNPRVICTNKQCSASYNKIEDKTKHVGLVLDELVQGYSLREIRDILEKKHSCKYSHMGIKKWLKNHNKMIKTLTDDITCSLKFGNAWEVDETRIKLLNGECWITAILDESSRFIIAYMVTGKRPDSKTLRGLFSEAKTVAKTPMMIITDLYLAYPKAIMSVFEDGVEHRRIRSNTKNKTSFSVGPNHNNHIRRSWKTIKRNALRNSSEWKWGDGIQYLIYYAILHYNYIRIHSRFDTTPAVSAGYVKPFKNFESILNDADTYEKAFLSKLGNYIKYVEITTPNHCKEIIISPKTSADHKITVTINNILEECGFIILKDKLVWERKTPLLHTFALNRNSDGRQLPERTFEICKKCGKVAISLQEIQKQKGFRRMSDGTIRTQPRCISCRHGKIKKTDGGNHALRSIIPISTIAKKGQSYLAGFPKEKIPNTLRNSTACVTEETAEIKSYLQLTIHGKTPRQILSTKNHQNT